MTPSNLSFIRKITWHAKSCVSLALEDLSAGNETLATDILKKEALKEIFMYGNSLLYKKTKAMLEFLESYENFQLKGLQKSFTYKKFEACLNQIDMQFASELSGELLNRLKFCFTRISLKKNRNIKNLKDLDLYYEKLKKDLKIELSK